MSGITLKGFYSLAHFRIGALLKHIRPQYNAATMMDNSPTVGIIGNYLDYRPPYTLLLLLVTLSRGTWYLISVCRLLRLQAPLFAGPRLTLQRLMPAEAACSSVERDLISDLSSCWLLRTLVLSCPKVISSLSLRHTWVNNTASVPS